MKNRKKTSLKSTLSEKYGTKRLYVWRGLLTMVTVAVFVNPVKRSLSALKRCLSSASEKEGRIFLRETLSNSAYSPQKSSAHPKKNSKKEKS